MLDLDQLQTLDPIGVVNSRILERRDMPPHGVEAEIEIFPRYRDGLLLIEENSHLWIIGWFSGAERERLQLVRPEYRSGHRRRGVFGLRSTTRPNPIGVTAVRLLDMREGRLIVDHLDFLDGTMVLDIKRYSPSWDTIFSARSSRERFLEIEEAAQLELLEIEGAKFRGALTPAVVAAARLMRHVVRLWQVLPRDNDLRITVPAEGPSAELADALQGMTGATFGSGRLAVSPEGYVVFAYNHQTLAVKPQPLLGKSLDDVRNQPLYELFQQIRGSDGRPETFACSS